jgi:hypothetical protein
VQLKNSGLFFLILFVSAICVAQIFIPFAFWRKKTAWTPTDLGINLLAWYDTTDASTIRTGAAGISQASTGDPVSEWQDKSGHSYHADQSVSARQPTYNSSGWTGGLPTITWNAIDNGLVITGLNWQNYSFAMVIRHVTVSGVRALLTKRSAVSANFFWFIYDSTSGNINWDQNGNRYNTSFAPTAGIDYLYTLVRPLAGSSRNQYVNGTLMGTTASNSDDNNTQNIIFGNDYSAANRGASAHISELVIVGNDLATSDRESLEGYLAWKWGLVSGLPLSHPYKISPP